MPPKGSNVTKEKNPSGCGCGCEGYEKRKNPSREGNERLFLTNSFYYAVFIDDNVTVSLPRGRL
jgi:hypothetical protein